MPTDIITYGNAFRGVYVGTQKGVLKSVIAGAAQAKSLTPVDKGQLRNSIGYSAEVQGKIFDGGYNQDSGEKSPDRLESQGKGTTGYYGTANEYAPYVEDGTRTMVAQPFLTPSAAIISGEKTVSEVKKELNDQMAREVRSGTKATRIR